MTINGIPSASSYTACVSPEARLAVTILSNEQQQQDIDHEMVADARRDFVQQSAAEVAALHDAADDIARGGWAQAGVVMAGALIQGSAVYLEGRVELPGATSQCKAWDTVRGIGQGASSGLSPALGKLLGDGPEADHRAGAKRAGTAAQEAQWEMDDSKGAIQRSLQDEQHTVEWLGRTVDSESSANATVLSNMA